MEDAARLEDLREEARAQGMDPDRVVANARRAINAAIERIAWNEALDAAVVATRRVKDVRVTSNMYIGLGGGDPVEGASLRKDVVAAILALKRTPPERNAG